MKSLQEVVKSTPTTGLALRSLPATAIAAAVEPAGVIITPA
jgi:hypothetical protein